MATPRAAASGRKRKAEAATSSSESPVEQDAERKYHDVEKEILDCPICLEQFTPPVYQCLNGHTVCLGCRGKIHHCPSCSQPVGSFIRNLLAERIVESLQVRCPYADHGCNQMMKFVDAERHMRSLCAYRPCPCPVPGCMHAGPKQTLPQHLEKEHQVEKTTKCMFTCYADFATWRFGLEASEQFVILEDHNKMPQLLLHREAIEGLGEILFCTCFEDHNITYKLQVMVVQDIYGDDYKPYVIIDGALAVDIRQRSDWKKGAILCCDPEKLTGKDALLQIRIPWP